MLKKVEKTEKIPFDLFKSVDLRIGKIVEAKTIKGSDKLLKLMVDIGTETRQVVAGIAQALQTRGAYRKPGSGCSQS